MFERRYQTFKRLVNRTMDRTNTPPELWFLCMCYIAYVLNRVSDPSLNHKQPIFAATGRTGDISALLSFSWLEPVYYKIDDVSFPSESPEGLGYWVGIAEHVGHALTYKIWSKKTGKILHRSAVRSARDKDINFCADPEFEQSNSNLNPTTHPNSSRVFTAQDYGEKESGRPPDNQTKSFIYSNKDKDSPQLTDGEKAYLIEGSSIERNDDVMIPTDEIYVVLNNENGEPTTNADGQPILIKGMDHTTLKGITFLKREEDGTKNRIQVIEAIEDRRKGNKDFSEFLIKYDRDQVEDIMSYNDIMNHIHRDQIEDGGNIWKFRQILGHQGPLNPQKP